MELFDHGDPRIDRMWRDLLSRSTDPGSQVESHRNQGVSTAMDDEVGKPFVLPRWMLLGGDPDSKLLDLMPEHEWYLIEFAAMCAYQCYDSDAEICRKQAGYDGLHKHAPDQGATRYDEEGAWNFTDDT